MTRNRAEPLRVPLPLKNLVIQSLEDDKAEQIEIIDLPDHYAMADHLIVASGRSSRQVVALADNLARRLSEKGVTNVRIEGQRQGDWVVVDAGDIIIHLFRPEVRAFYNIERIWRPDSFLAVASPLNALHGAS